MAWQCLVCLRERGGFTPPSAKRTLKATGLYVDRRTKWRTLCPDLCLGRMVLAAVWMREGRRERPLTCFRGSFVGLQTKMAAWEGNSEILFLSHLVWWLEDSVCGGAVFQGAVRGQGCLSTASQTFALRPTSWNVCKGDTRAGLVTSYPVNFFTFFPHTGKRESFTWKSLQSDVK